MILSKSQFVSLVLGSAGVFACTAGPNADEYVRSAKIQPVAARCAQFGADFVDAGNGVCRRTAGHIRAYVRIPSAGLVPMTGWGGTSSAALRSYEPGMVPGASTTQHLRLRGPLDGAGYYR